MIREQGLLVSSSLGNITHEYSRTWPDLFDHQSIAVTQFQAFLYQQSGFIIGSQFPALGDDLADLVQVDGANVTKSLHLFNVFSNDLRSAFAVESCSPRCTNLRDQQPLFSLRSERF